MIRYHFNVYVRGVRVKVSVNARNPMSAYGKVKRLNPMAEKIHLVRSEKISDY